jgi:hypothetical protein
MSYRPYAAILLTAAAASAVVAWNPLATVIIGGSTAALLVGLQWKRVVPTLAAGWLLYLPMAVTLTRFFPASWSYLAAGLFAVVVPEKLVFEYEVSAVLGSPTGVDAEARSRISKLSTAHTREMSVYAALALGVMAIASLASGLTSYASELITAAMLLILIIMIYATR